RARGLETGDGGSRRERVPGDGWRGRGLARETLSTELTPMPTGGRLVAAARRAFHRGWRADQGPNRDAWSVTSARAHAFARPARGEPRPGLGGVLWASRGRLRLGEAVERPAVPRMLA